MIDETVAAQASTVSKPNSIVRTAGGNGTMRTHARVTMPRVPSLPTTTPRRSYPAASGPSAPNRSSGAVGHHDVEREHVRARDAVGEAVRARPRSCSRCPPIDEVCWLEGSGA